MKYLLATALRHIKKNAAVYLLIIIEITIGLAAVLCCRNILGGAKERLVETKKELVKKPIEIEFYKYGALVLDPLSDGLSYEKGMDFYENFKDRVNVCFGKKDGDVIYLPDENNDYGKYVEFRVMFVNDEMFEYYFGTPMRHDTVYADMSTNINEQSAYRFITDAMQNGDISMDYIEDRVNSVAILSIKDGGLYFIKDTPINIEQQPTPLVEYTYSDEYSQIYHYTNKTIFIPLDYYPQYFEALYPYMLAFKDSENMKVSAPKGKLILTLKDENFDTNLVSEAIKYLEEVKNPEGYTFKVTDEISDIQQRVEYLDAQTVQLRLSAYALLIMAVLCTAGVLIIFVNRRRKEMAVRIACGEGRARVAAGLFVELFCVTLTGAALGFLFAAVISGILKNGEYAFGDLQNYMLQNAAISLGFALLCSAVPVLLAVSGVIRLQPARVLKGE